MRVTRKGVSRRGAAQDERDDAFPSSIIHIIFISTIYTSMVNKVITAWRAHAVIFKFLSFFKGCYLCCSGKFVIF